MLKVNLQLFAVRYDKDMDVATYLDSLNNGSEVDKHYRSEFAKSLGYEGTDSPEEVKAIADYLNRPKDTNKQKSTDTGNTDGSSSHYMSQIKANTGIGVNQSARDAINTPFTASTAYQEAMNYTNQLLQQMSSGRTSYTDQINDLMGQIKNRDPFEYDVDSDMLFQQYLASSMASGKTAMQDAMGQAAALTGGYGSTYATAVGNQQYNAYIQDAYHNLPEYYQLALDAYEQEGQEMYDQLAMLNAADAQEYQRMYDAWNANYANAQQMYENEYGAWQDKVANGYNSAALQLEEQAQKYDQAYQTYAAVKDYEDTLFEQAQYIADNDVNGDGIVDYVDLQMRNSGSGGVDGNLTDDMSFSTTEINGIKSAYRDAGGGNAGYEAVTEYLKGIGKYQGTEEFLKMIDSYINSADAQKGIPVWYQTWNLTNDTKNRNNILVKGNEDYNDTYTNLNGDKMTYKELKNAINKSALSKEEKEELLKSLSAQSKR